MARAQVGFLQGLFGSVPIVLAYFPVAVSFGVTASKSGFSVAEATFMSLVIYAGASQFLATTLLAGGAGPLLAIVSLLTLNARHLLYAPALLERVRRTQHGRQPLRTPWLWAHGLTDEVFASALGRLAIKDASWSERWQVGIGLGAYLAWVSGTAVGALLGGGAFERWPAVDAALAFLMPTLFLSLLLAMVQRHHWPVVVTAVVGFAVGSALFSASSGILLGMLAGGLVGMFLAPREAVQT
ncbi:MAG: AzlC family ABC transporter permease [Trueperaceae bacterium]